MTLYAFNALCLESVKKSPTVLSLEFRLVSVLFLVMNTTVNLSPTQNETENNLVKADERDCEQLCLLSFEIQISLDYFVFHL